MRDPSVYMVFGAPVHRRQRPILGGAAETLWQCPAFACLVVSGPGDVVVDQLLRALWSLLDGIWDLLKGSWGVLAQSVTKDYYQRAPRLYVRGCLLLTSNLLGLFDVDPT